MASTDTGQPSSAAKRPTRSDFALAAGLLVVAILSGFNVDTTRPDTHAPSTWWHWVLICLPASLVAVRRVKPIAVTALVTMVQSVIWIIHLPEVLLSAMVILYTAASDAGKRGRQAAVAASVVLTAVTCIGVVIAADVTPYQVPLIVLTLGTALVLGVSADRQRRLGELLAAQVTEVRLTSAHERAQAVAAERSHIARELHDIIGHTLTVIAVRAEAADRVSQSRPDAAGAAVSDIAAAARSALSDTRRVLAGLREPDQVDLAPAPTLAATRRLVSDLADAGVAARLIEDGCGGPEPPAVIASSIHRIVTESLTNAVKHGGPGVAVEVYLTCSPGHFDIRVINSLKAGVVVTTADDRGVGLAGMAERAELLGGTFQAVNAGDRFIVHAGLPLGSPERSRS